MAERVAIDVYCEDQGHEQFCTALMKRLAREEGRSVQLSIRSGRGGSGRAITEFKAWQRAARKLGRPQPDLLIVIIDANCMGWNEKRAEVEKAVDQSLFPHHVLACPDPHVERWCLADPDGFKSVVGKPPLPDPGKCERAAYKDLLRRSIEDAGQLVLGDVMEYAPDLVAEMDLYRAGKNQTSLKNFVDSLKAALRLT